MVYYSLLWFTMVYYGLLWFTVVYYGLLWFTIVYCGFLWFTIVYCGLVWFTMVKFTKCWGETLSGQGFGNLGHKSSGTALRKFWRSWNHHSHDISWHVMTWSWNMQHVFHSHMQMVKWSCRSQLPKIRWLEKNLMFLIKVAMDWGICPGYTHSPVLDKPTCPRKRDDPGISKTGCRTWKHPGSLHLHLT